MELKPGQIGLQQTGPTSLAGGVRRDIDARYVPNGAASVSENFVHRQGRLSLRLVQTVLSGFTSGVTSSNRGKAWTGMLAGKLESGAPFVICGSASRFFSLDGGGWDNLSGSFSFGASADTDPWWMCYGVDGSTAAENGGVFAANGVAELAHLKTVSGSFTSGFVALSSETGSGYDGPSSMIPRYCTVFNGRLILSHITEGSTVHGTRTRGSAVNSFFTFNTANGAFVVDHADSPGEVTGLARLGESLLVLKEDSILYGLDTGSTIIFPQGIDTGCISGFSFRSHKPYKALFLGRDNIYETTIGAADPIGDPIAADLFSNLDRNLTRQIVSDLDTDRALYRIWIPVSGGSAATRCYVYNWLEKVWFVENWPNEVHATAQLVFGSGTTIGGLTGTIGSYSGVTIGSWGATSTSPRTLIASKYGSSDYRVNLLAAGAQDYASSPQTLSCLYESGDLRFNPTGFATLRFLTLQYSASASVTVTVMISTDRGASWTGKVQTLAADEDGEARFTFLSYGLYHRLRIEVSPESTVTSFDIHGAEASYIMRGARR